MTFALALCFGLTSVATAAPTGTKALTATKKPHHHHQLRGVVVSVHHDKVSSHGEIKVKVHHPHHKKLAKSAAAAASSKKKHHHGVVTVHVNGATKFERVVHNQGKVHRHSATFADVHKGEHVHVALHSGQNHHAKEVDIVVRHHNKKLTPPAVKKKPLLKKKTK